MLKCANIYFEVDRSKHFCYTCTILDILVANTLLQFKSSTILIEKWSLLKAIKLTQKQKISKVTKSNSIRITHGLRGIETLQTFSMVSNCSLTTTKIQFLLIKIPSKRRAKIITCI